MREVWRRYGGPRGRCGEPLLFFSPQQDEAQREDRKQREALREEERKKEAEEEKLKQAKEVSYPI